MNLAERLLAHADREPPPPALWWRDEWLDQGELAGLAARGAAGLRERGVARGDRVGVVCGNEPSFVVAYLAALRLGAVAVPVNPLATPVELAAELGGTGARIAVVGRGPLASVTAAVEDHRLDLSVVVAQELPTLAEDTRPDADPDPGPAAGPADVEPGTPAVLAHTSGTAGRPRAAILTHGSLAANIDQALSHPTLRIEPADVVLGVLPLFHSYGLNAVLGLALRSGAPVALTEGFDPRATLELVDRLGVSVVLGVPPMFAAWCELPEAPTGALGGVRVAVSGAAALPRAVQERFRERFGVVLHQGYGLTEASPMVTTTGEGGDPRPGSIGLPLPGVEVRLVDRAGGDVLVGDPGEVWVRGDNVFAGYWEDEEATREVLTPEGWLRTGDVAVADDDGFLSIVDRLKDLIIVSGFNVFPAEVEEVLVAHEAVAEAAVVGVPDPATGEAVHAYAVLASDRGAAPEELVEHCRRSLARYKCPSSVEVVDAVPRGLGGKLRRRELPVPEPPP